MKSTRDIFYNLKLLSKKWEPYFDIYDRHFAKYINKKPKVLEIGMQNGGSMEMWYEYFQNATLFGIDNNPNVKTIDFKFDLQIDVGNQADLKFWKNYLMDKPNFDIIIDDGGHEMAQQANTLISLFPKLNPGGIYLVEDTHTSYWAQWGGGFRKPDTFMEISKGLIDLLNVMHMKDQLLNPKLLEIFNGISSISFYNSVVVFEKDVNKPFNEAVSTQYRIN